MTETKKTNDVVNDYPVKVDDVVALGLAPNHHGEVECPVGMVDEVNKFGVKISCLSWLTGEFGCRIVFVAWDQIKHIEWAEVLEPGDAKGRRKVYACDPLGYTQTKWIHGTEEAKADARTKLDVQARLKQ